HVAEPTIPLMKSRRRIALTKAGTTPNRTRLQQGFPTGGMGPTDISRGNNSQDRMSALGQKRTSRHLQPMSALPPIADIADSGQKGQVSPAPAAPSQQICKRACGRVRT